MRLTWLAPLLALFLAFPLLAAEEKQPSPPVTIQMDTSMGSITLELYPDQAPETVTNFVRYTKAGYYDGTIFHRVIPGFMIQGGGMTGDMQPKKTGDPIPNEADNGLKNDRGSIAMARTSDPHSATAQFFINLKDNDFLNHQGKDVRRWGYAVFGRVIQGMDVVDAIAKVPTTDRGIHQNVPVDPVRIVKMSIKNG